MKSLYIVVALAAFIALVKAHTAKSPFREAITDSADDTDSGVKNFNKVAKFKTKFNKRNMPSFLTTEPDENERIINELFESIETIAKLLNIQKLRELFEKVITSVAEQANNAVTLSPEVQKNINLVEKSIKAIKIVLVRLEDVIKKAEEQKSSFV